MNSDILSIKELRVEATLGAYAWEQCITRTVILDLDFKIDASHAAHADQLQDTVDYHQLCDRTREFLQQESFQLIETLAEQTAQFILSQFKISWLRLTIYKLSPLAGVKHIAITVERAGQETVRTAS